MLILANPMHVFILTNYLCQRRICNAKHASWQKAFSDLWLGLRPTEGQTNRIKQAENDDQATLSGYKRYTLLTVEIAG
jgi:hypothetical protein